MIWNLNSVGHTTQDVEMEWQEEESTELLNLKEIPIQVLKMILHVALIWAYNDQYENYSIWIRKIANLGVYSCKRRGMEGGGRIYIFNSLVTTFLSKISYDIF